MIAIDPKSVVNFTNNNNSNKQSLLTCPVQFLDDRDPFSCNSINPEPVRPLLYSFRLEIPLINQLPGLQKFLNSPQKIDDCTLQIYKNLSHKSQSSNASKSASGISYQTLKQQRLTDQKYNENGNGNCNSNKDSNHSNPYISGEFCSYLDLDATLQEQKEELELLENESGSLVLRTQLTVRVHQIIEKLLNSDGRQLRRALFSLKQLFQDDKDLVHEFVNNDGLSCLIKVGMEADQNYQNYILRALSQIMLYVDGMHGIMNHEETLQWLCSLLTSKFRLIVKTSLKLILVFLEYKDSNADLFLKSLSSTYQHSSWKCLVDLMEDKECTNDFEIIVHTITIINKTLTNLSNPHSKIPTSDGSLLLNLKLLDSLGLPSIVRRYSCRKSPQSDSCDIDFVEQLNQYQTLTKLSELSSLMDDDDFCRRSENGDDFTTAGELEKVTSALNRFKKRASEWDISSSNYSQGHERIPFTNYSTCNGFQPIGMDLSSSSSTSYGSCRSTSHNNNNNNSRAMPIKTFTHLYEQPDQTTAHTSIIPSHSCQSSTTSSSSSSSSPGQSSSPAASLFSWRDKFKRSDLVTAKPDITPPSVQPLPDQTRSNRIGNGNCYLIEVPVSEMDSYLKQIPSAKASSGPTPSSARSKFQALEASNCSSAHSQFFGTSTFTTSCNYTGAYNTTKAIVTPSTTTTNYNNNDNSSKPIPNSVISSLMPNQNLRNYGGRAVPTKDDMPEQSSQQTQLKPGTMVMGKDSMRNITHAYKNSGQDSQEMAKQATYLNSHQRKEEFLLKGSTNYNQNYFNNHQNNNDSSSRRNHPIASQYTSAIPTAKPTFAPPQFINNRNPTNTVLNSGRRVPLNNAKSQMLDNLYRTSSQQQQQQQPGVCNNNIISNRSRVESPPEIQSGKTFPETVSSRNSKEPQRHQQQHKVAPSPPSQVNNFQRNQSSNQQQQVVDQQPTHDNQPRSNYDSNTANERSNMHTTADQSRQILAELNNSNVSQNPISAGSLENFPAPYEPQKSESQIEWEKLLGNLKRPLKVLDIDFSDLTAEDDVDVFFRDERMYPSAASGPRAIPPPPPPLGGIIPPPPPPGFTNPRSSPIPPPPPPGMKINPRGIGLNKNLSASTMSLTSGTANNVRQCSPVNQNTSRKTLRLFWREIKPVVGQRQPQGFAKIEKTVWTKIRPISLDNQKLEYLFETRAKELPKERKEESGKKNYITVLDSKRSNAINIGMTKLPPVRAIKAAVMKMDNSIMNRECLEKLLTTMIPTEDEKQKIFEAQLTYPELPLGTAEQFLSMLSSISELEARLKLWAFKQDYDGLERDIAEPMLDLKVGLKELEDNRTMDYVLSVILAVGNFLNGTECKAFNFEYLSKLPEVKDTVQKQSLLHHVCQFVMERFPDSSDLYSELGSLVRSSRVDFDDLTNNLEKIESLCKESWDHLRAVIKHETGPVLKIRMSEFISDCAQRIMVLKIVHRRLLNRYNKTLKYYGFNAVLARDMKITTFCRLFSDFALEYKTARERLVEDMKKKQRHKDRNMTRGKMITETLKEASGDISNNIKRAPIIQNGNSTNFYSNNPLTNKKHPYNSGSNNTITMTSAPNPSNFQKTSTTNTSTNGNSNIPNQQIRPNQHKMNGTTTRQNDESKETADKKLKSLLTSSTNPFNIRRSSSIRNGRQGILPAKSMQNLSYFSKGNPKNDNNSLVIRSLHGNGCEEGREYENMTSNSLIPKKMAASTKDVSRTNNRTPSCQRRSEPLTKIRGGSINKNGEEVFTDDEILESMVKRNSNNRNNNANNCSRRSASSHPTKDRKPFFLKGFM